MKILFIFLSLLFATLSEGQINPTIDLAHRLTTGKTYGAYCGIAGKHPPTRIIAERLIADKDIDTLESWLSSPNPVNVTYAAEALIRIYNQGTLLSEELIERVSQVKELETLISTCKGCFYEQLSIKESLIDFSFDRP